MKKVPVLLLLFALTVSLRISAQTDDVKLNPPIYIAFLWHMHQPVYWPYESIGQTELNNRYPYSVFDIHNQRVGPYTSWPKDAVQMGINANFPHFGAQVSFSGSLIENLNNLENYGNQNFQNWKSHWNSIKTQSTSLGNPRMDMVAFGYFHPLLGLIDHTDTRKQIQHHKEIFSQNFSGNYSKGIFPPENAFSPRMIPALLDEGIEWVMVDNIHFERACENYPFNTGGNIYEPNKSDVMNSDPGDWIQLNGLWAPTPVSAQWSRQPHYAAYIDPSTGIEHKIIAVPTDRYMGNEDGRGGFGALNYEAVMSQLEPYNTDPNHPILIVLHHDGDNFGGGSESYYHSNFQNFVNWLQANPSRFVCTTVQDYLEMFPPDPNDVIYVEDGSWSGADNGDPEFKKWNGDPGTNGYSPDRNSWGVITAAKNFVLTAEQINPNSNNTKEAWKYFLCGEASDYWYWDGSQNGIWDSHAARAVNLAIPFAQSVISGGTDLTGPTIYLPQREPYNPGATEWGISMSGDITVWSYVFDVNGLSSVKLKYRTDLDGLNNPNTIHNETYAGGSDVTGWTDLTMTGTEIASQTNPLPLFKAKEYSAEITGLDNKLVDYYIEAVDNNGNISRSPIKQVWVGNYNPGGSNGVYWVPINPTEDDTITIVVTGVQQGAKLHWGVNNTGSSWQTPDSVYWPAGSYLYNGTGPAVESPMIGPNGDSLYIKIGAFNQSQVVERVAFVIHFDDGTWNNNNGNDFHIYIGGTCGTFIMDGELDAANSFLAATNNGLDLYLGWNGTELYVATQSAQSTGNDHFIFVADSQRTMIQAPWAKTGMVAGWNLFLGNESTNNWSGWFDQTGTVQNAAGNYLEGTVGVQSEFGYLPNEVYIAIGSYQTDDNGVLLNQVPAGNGDGNIDQNELYEFDLTITETDEKENLSKEFLLYQNYPNPFNPRTSMQYAIGSSRFVTLKIYDVLGNEVVTLVNEELSAGKYTVEFNSSDYNLASGVYIYRLEAGEFSAQKKFMLLK